MAYKVIARKADKQTIEPWTGKFTLAKDHAVGLVKSGKADRVDIRDDLGRLRYHYPRMMRRG